MQELALISLFLATLLLAAVPLPNAEETVDVVVDECTEDQTMKKDMECAHNFLDAVRGDSVNCSVELKKFKDCIKNFMMNTCFANYLKTHSDKRQPLGRLADFKSSLHNFAGLLCGVVQDQPANLSGLPPELKKVPKCEEPFFEKSKKCARDFHQEYAKNPNATDLCPLYVDAKKCIGGAMKYCGMHKPPPYDKFNPFCPGKEDPHSDGVGTIKAYMISTFFMVALAFYVLS